MRSLRSLFAPSRIVDAHCDIPCGVYDPEQARIEAESCLRIIEKYEQNTDAVFRDRWGAWPMRGWLDAFVEEGLVERTASGDYRRRGRS